MHDFVVRSTTPFRSNKPCCYGEDLQALRPAVQDFERAVSWPRHSPRRCSLLEKVCKDDAKGSLWHGRPPPLESVTPGGGSALHTSRSASSSPWQCTAHSGQPSRAVVDHAWGPPDCSIGRSDTGLGSHPLWRRLHSPWPVPCGTDPAVALPRLHRMALQGKWRP